MAKQNNGLSVEIMRCVSERRPAKIEKWHERIKTMVRNAQGADRAKTIVRICRELIRGQLALSAYPPVGDVVDDPLLCVPVNRAACERVTSVLRLIACTLLADGDVASFLRVLQYSVDQGDVIPDTDEGAHLAVRLAGIRRFLMIFLQEAGASEETGVRFAILLCEAWDAQALAITRDLDVAARTEEESDLVSLLRRKKKAIEKKREANNLSREDADVLAVRALNLIADAAMGGGDDQAPWVTAWFDRLVHAAAKGRMASEVLLSLLNVMTTMDHRPSLEIIANGLLQERSAQILTELGDALDEMPEYGEVAKLYQSPTVRLSQHTDAVFKQWSDRLRAEQRRARECGDAVLRWITDEREAIERLMDQRCERIVNHPRRGLRPNGHDHIEVQVSALRNAGVRALVFRAEGHVFPDISVEVITRYETPTLHVFKTELREFLLDLDEGVLVWKEHADRSFDLLRLLDFVVIDALYRIVAGPQELREKRSWQATGDASVILEPRRIPVRPFLRRLPAGFKASEEAEEKAKREMGWRLRPGMTFVSATVRNGQLEYDLPTQPTAVYSDDDLFLAEKE